ncbi:MAG: type II toxin-antitoxin system RelE/ParE family toxin [Bythopirellula sp.]|nr:type II toxin-antitoxin system RelE/ParE family toxin [Bythopirellula sp.]
MKSLRYTSKAHTDVKEILLYISEDKLGAALKFVERIEARCDLIASNPEMGELRPEYGPGVRSVSVGKYVIYHSSTPKEVLILRIVPGVRDIRSL